MAFRMLTLAAVLAMLTTTGCKTSSSNYQRPACAPAVVATTPVQPACPGPVPAPAPIPVVPR
jgi:hypothetical protein